VHVCSVSLGRLFGGDTAEGCECERWTGWGAVSGEGEVESKGEEGEDEEEVAEDGGRRLCAEGASVKKGGKYLRAMRQVMKRNSWNAGGTGIGFSGSWNRSTGTANDRGATVLARLCLGGVGRAKEDEEEKQEEVEEEEVEEAEGNEEVKLERSGAGNRACLGECASFDRKSSVPWLVPNSFCMESFLSAASGAGPKRYLDTIEANWAACNLSRFKWSSWGLIS